MKYVIAWTVRDTGAAEPEVRRLLDVFSKWTPAGATFHQFVGRIDNNGSFAVVETDDPMNVLRDVSKFEPWLRYEVYPVVDIQDVAIANTEAVEFRAGIS